MSELMWIRSHVELLLQLEWASGEVMVDSDGDFPFRHGTAMCWVSVVEYDIPMVRVFAHAAYGLKPTAKLLRELNDIQNRCVSARISLADGVAVVSQTVSPIRLTQPVLVQAMDAVANVADDIGGLLAAVFGGNTPFDADVAETDSEAARRVKCRCSAHRSAGLPDTRRQLVQPTGSTSSEICNNHDGQSDNKKQNVCYPRTEARDVIAIRTLALSAEIARRRDKKP